jgi:hypothetical protein
LAWFADITAGQPPGRQAAMNASASGTHSHGVGSAVPVQSNSRRKRDRSVRGLLAPCEMHNGRIARCASGATQRKPAPFGAHTHLCRLPV